MEPRHARQARSLAPAAPEASLDELLAQVARGEEVLSLDVDELDLRNRRAKVRRKGGADIVVWRTATAPAPAPAA